MNNKKFLLIFPPLWSISSPHIALPSLAAQLKKSGFETRIIDLNIEFFNHVLTTDYLKTCIQKANDEYLNICKMKSTFYEKFDTTEQKILNYKYNELSQNLNDTSRLYKIADKIKDTIEIFKNPDLFYNHKLITTAALDFWTAIKICSLPYLPSYISNNFNYINDFLKYNMHDIKNIIFNSSQNMFLDFYKTKIDEILKNNYSYIGISISSQSQVIAGLTIACLLKKHTKAHINIGGGYFSRSIENLKQNIEFFDIFADSISYNEGEKSIIELAKYINNELSIDKVPNLLYKKNNEIITNEQCSKVILSQISIPDYSDYSFEKYYTPNYILPLQTNRGCYWNKCTFCDHSYGKTYTTKKIESIIEEIKYYKEKYNVSYFDIIDEAIHPKILEQFSKALILNKLDIKYKIYMRLEECIDYKLLKNAYKSGLRIIQWGFETGNERIHKLINKGVNFDKRLKIIKESDKAGIINYIFAFFNFPTETYEEAMETINYLKNNYKSIQITGLGEFILTNKSFIIENPSLFGIEDVEKSKDFSQEITYKISDGMTIEEKSKLRKNYMNIFSKFYISNIFNILNFIDRQYPFLYNAKYNLKLLKKIKIKQDYIEKLKS